jgi:hypothetical protein
MLDLGKLVVDAAELGAMRQRQLRRAHRLRQPVKCAYCA